MDGLILILLCIWMGYISLVQIKNKNTVDSVVKEHEEQVLKNNEQQRQIDLLLKNVMKLKGG